MSQPFNPLNPRNNRRHQDYRIGDAERQKAMDDLGKHFTAGRLDITEYDNRLTSVAEATMWSDLIPIFSDLPAITDTNTSATIPHAAGIPEEDKFSRSEIEENYRSGKRIKLGIMILMFMAAMSATLILQDRLVAFTTMMTFLAMFVLLYVMKLGPKSWHQPSPRASGAATATANRPSPGHAGAGDAARSCSTNGATTSPPATTASRNH